MSLATLLSQDVTIVSPGARIDAHRNTLPDWSAATRVVVKGRVEQTDTVEVLLGRDAVVSDSLLFLMPDAVVSAYDRVEAAGAVFEVVGSPALVTTPRGPHHFEVRLRAVVG